jgi:hypothetical protein
MDKAIASKLQKLADFDFNDGWKPLPIALMRALFATNPDFTFIDKWHAIAPRNRRAILRAAGLCAGETYQHGFINVEISRDLRTRFQPWHLAILGLVRLDFGGSTLCITSVAALRDTSLAKVAREAVLKQLASDRVRGGLQLAEYLSDRAIESRAAKLRIGERIFANEFEEADSESEVVDVEEFEELETELVLGIGEECEGGRANG